MLKNKRVLEFLACPKCKGEVAIRGETITCKGCKGRYPIKNGVPILLDKEDMHLAFEDISDLEECKNAWKKKKILRETYISWYRKITPFIEDEKLCVEVSGGIGNFKEHLSSCINSDIRYTRYIDFVTSATNMAAKDSSIDTVVVIDGIHHYEDVFKFFDEALRVLKPGGRLVMIEPYLSTFSTFIRKRFHHEDIDFGSMVTGKKALEANLAIPTLLFFRKEEFFRQKYPQFRIIKKDRFEHLVYPLTGGFRKRSMIPPFLYKPLRFLENFLPFKRKLFAYKMMAVLEKK